MKKRQKIYLCFKRIFDLLFSFLAIIILLPFFLIMSLIIIIDSRGPVFFKQERVGKNNKLFKIIKFRSMTHLKTKDVFEVTRVGRFMRKTSIDELPQLINIFLGQMSFIGPRPVTTIYDYDIYVMNERSKYGVHLIKPGLSGWAQVNGRDQLSMEDKVKYDVEYYQKFSLLMDIKILFKSIGVTLSQKGVVGERHRETKSETKEKETINQ